METNELVFIIGMPVVLFGVIGLFQLSFHTWTRKTTTYGK
jgi:hypothetical protein